MDSPLLWQDVVITVGQVLLFLALLPSIFSPNKPDKKTSLLTGAILAVFAFTFWTLGLYYGSLTSALVSLAWFVLFAQKVFLK
jgi:hypothetical protein